MTLMVVTLVILTACGGDDSEQQIEDLNAQVGDYAAQVRTLQDDLAEAQSDAELVQAEVEQLEQVNDHLSAELDETRTSLETELDEVRAAEDGALTRATQAEARVRELEELLGGDEGIEQRQNRQERQAAQAALEESRDDGIYTVGTEIAAGTWESQGTGDDCYWRRINETQDTIDNHYGAAGGRVTIQESDTEVEFQDCGIWEYQG